MAAGILSFKDFIHKLIATSQKAAEKFLMPLAYFGIDPSPPFPLFGQNFDLSRNLPVVVAFVIYRIAPLRRLLHAANSIARLIVVLN